MCRSGNASWKHLFLECPKTVPQKTKMFAMIEKDLTELVEKTNTDPDSFRNPIATSETSKNCTSLLRTLVDADGDNNSNLIRFLFGICCTDSRGQQSALRHIPVLEVVINATAEAIRSVQDAWWDATLEEQGIIPD